MMILELMLLIASAVVPAQGTAGADNPRPNILVIRIDDARSDDMKARRPDGSLVLQNVHDLITAQGTTFTSNFCPTSLCCPSRASFYSGQYAHNHGVYGNNPPLGGVARFDHSNSLPVWLRAAGYFTGHIGKYMNGYGAGSVLPGWDYWMTQKSGATAGYYYNYVMNENGVQVGHGSSIRDYATDVFTQKAVDFFNRRLFGSQPFFLVIDYTAPHIGQDETSDDGRGLATPAARHKSVFAKSTFTWGPAFDEADVSDKPPAIQALPTFTQDDLDYLTLAHQDRLGSLLAVDEGVAQILEVMGWQNVLSNTYIVFLSDNGFVKGEHRLVSGKNDAYEECIRVPMVISGPGVRAGVTCDEIVANIDLAPTFCEIAGAKASRVMDGKSIVPLFTGGSFTRQQLLIEGFAYSLPPNSLRRTYAGLRTAGYSYIETDEDGNGVFDPAVDAQELYPLQGDGFFGPDLYELDSRHGEAGYAGLIGGFQQQIQALLQCSGSSCP